MKPRIQSLLYPALGVVLFAVLGGYTLLVVPVGEGPDEYGHLSYALHIHSLGLPDPEEDLVSMDHHPPLYYGLGACAVRLLGPGKAAVWADKPEIVTRPAPLPGPYRTELQYASVPATRELVLSPAYTVRLVSLFFGALLFVGMFLGATWAFQGNRRAVWASVGWAFLPGVVFSAAVASNDIAVAALTTLIYALYLRVLGGRFLTEPWHGLVLGLLLGAAVMTKSSGLIPTILLPLVVGLGASRPWRKAVVWNGAMALIIFGLVLVGGWFYLANLANQGDMFLTDFLVANRPELALPFSVNENYIGHVLTRLVRGYLGELGRQDIELARPMMMLFLLLGGAACGGVVILIRDHWLRFRPARKLPAHEGRGHFVLSDLEGMRAEAREAESDDAEEPPLLSGSSLLFCLVAVILTLGLLVRWNFLFYGPYGRYLHVVLLPVTLLCVGGLRRLLGKEKFKVVAPILALGPLLATVFTVFFDLLPHYHTAWSKWTRGEVIAYDDGGNPRAEPHRVTGPGIGGVYEPWGTYSTARVPEMNLAWGYPEVKFRYDGLDATAPYQVRVTYYGGREPGKFGLVPYQELLAGSHRIHGPIPLTFTPRELSFSLPKGVITRDGRLDLTFRRVRGAAAGVAEVWLERAWISLKAADLKRDPAGSGNQVHVQLRLENRDARQDHGAALHLFAEESKGVLHTLLRQKTESAIRHGRPWIGDLAAESPAKNRSWRYLVGVRRKDQGPWAILKGATNIGPEGEKRGDLKARDLHVATLKKGRTGVVLRATFEEIPAGPYRVRLRYRSEQPGSVHLLARKGVMSDRFPVPGTGGKYQEIERTGVAEKARAVAVEVLFDRPGEAAVDEILIWPEGETVGFHLYPIRNQHR